MRQLRALAPLLLLAALTILTAPHASAGAPGTVQAPYPPAGYYDGYRLGADHAHSICIFGHDHQGPDVRLLTGTFAPVTVEASVTASGGSGRVTVLAFTPHGWLVPFFPVGPAEEDHYVYIRDGIDCQGGAGGPSYP